jgi:hypothetical protein
VTEKIEAPSSALPAGAQFHRIAFAAGPAAGETVLAEFPPALGRRAIVIGTDPAVTPARGELLVLAVPATGDEDLDLLAEIRDWADPPTTGVERTGQVLTLQGAQVFWAPARLAVVASTDRLHAVRNAAIEVAYYDAELGAIETELATLWPELEADTPLAFAFAEQSVRLRRQLAERFRRVFTLRARLARITPHVLAPHAHPPTLATQLNERLRERVRMAHRVESLDTQLQVFERVYDGCAQKVSEYMIARTGHTLEWVIIILLLAQTILVAVDLLSAGK